MVSFALSKYPPIPIELSCWGVLSIAEVPCLLKIRQVGVFVELTASFQATAVSTKSAGLQLFKLGVDLKVTICSIGWCVGPSSPRATES